MQQHPTRFKAGRRRLLAGLGSLAAAPSLGWGKDGAGPETAPGPNTLWYRQPAANWNEALPIGNGRLGAMVFGGVAQERLQINEDTLWSGAPYAPDSPDALAALPRVRQLIADGKYREASALASKTMMARPLTQAAYGTLGDLLLTFDKASAPAQADAAPQAYRRRLDLDTAIAGVSLRSGAGGTGSVRREAFVSAPDQVVVLHLTADGGRIGFDLAYRPPHGARTSEPDGSGLATVLTAPGAVDWNRVETAAAPDSSAHATLAADGDGAILITGRNEPGPQTAAGLRYAMRVRVVTDGRVDIDGGLLRVRGARTVTLLIAAATSHAGYRDVGADPVPAVRRQTDLAAAKPYALLRRDHVRDYRALFDTVALDLGGAAAAARPTNVRIAALDQAGAPDDPALAALYFQYGRYLLISSSRPGSQPANLQGIWNEGTNAPWGGKYTININTEMNYWPADPAGLGACVEPLLRMVEELAQTGARTARTMYGARGWVAHHNTDLWRAAAPIDGPEWGLWPCGGAWLCVALWDHYDYGRDPAVLRRLYPLLRGASEFFVDTLVEDPQGRGLVTSPSLSPENQHPFGSALCAGPAMDRQIIRDLFAHTIAAGALLDRAAADADPLLKTLAQTRARIAPDRVGAGGQLQEWLEDWDAAAPEQQHRHVSHLYGVYPSGQVNLRDTPSLFAAAKTSLNRRGDLATGWGTAWRLCLWARMGDGERAHAVLQGLIGARRTYPNMFDAHPPFQIDGNFGGAAGILEMLLQSWGGEVLLLPALPGAWPSGQVRGVRARGGLRVDLGWRAGELTALTVRGVPGTTVRLRYRGQVSAVRLDANGVFRLNGAKGLG